MVNMVGTHLPYMRWHFGCYEPPWDAAPRRGGTAASTDPQRLRPCGAGAAAAATHAQPCDRGQGGSSVVMVTGE